MSTGTLHDVYQRLLGALGSGEVVSAVDSALTDNEQFERVLASSYRHPNGFRKIVLGGADGGGRLRLHDWSAARPSRPSNVHNHRWPFASVVLQGTLRSTLYAEGPGGVEFERHRFVSGASGDRYEMSAKGLGRLEVLSVADCPSGSSYALGAQQLHRIEAAPMTMTVMLSGSPERDHTGVFRRAGLAPEPRELARVPARETRESLLMAARLLASLKM